MNRKLLYAQLARHGKADWQQSHDAFDRIVALTDQYNALNGGKWNRMMDYKPRNLPVFQRIEGSTTTRPLPVNLAPLYVFNGTDFTSITAEQVPLEGLGYEGNALAVQPERDIAFDLPHLRRSEEPTYELQ